MKVLIIKLSSIGDVVQTLPALHLLRKGLELKGIRPRVDWLVEEAASTILKGHPLIDNLIVVKRRGWLGGGNLRAVKAISKERYDMVLDFQGLLKSGVWVLLSGGKRRIGFSNSREMSPLFLNEKLPPYDPERHAVLRYLDLSSYAAGISPAGFEMPEFDPGSKAREGAAKKLFEKGVAGGEHYFVLVPYARWRTKLWVDDRFVELAKRITGRDAGMKAVLAGGPAEAGRLESMRHRIGPGAVNMAGETDLRELAALMRGASFIVTVDSGPMHIAAAAGARVVALFGPTAPWRTGPFGEGHAIVRKAMECSPCFRKTCGDVKCMGAISVEDVLGAVSGILREKRARAPM